MKTRNLEKLKYLKGLGVFNSQEARQQASISQSTLHRLQKEGLIEKVARGLFVHSGASINYEHLDYIIACKIFGPQAVIGGLSALSYYNLTEQVPMNIWVLVPPTKTKSLGQDQYRLIRTQLSLKTEVVKKDQFKIVSLERSLIEGLKHQSKLGEGLVFKAIKTALQNKLTTESKLSRVARKLNLMYALEKKWELLVA